jgi:hypothetical protein
LSKKAVGQTGSRADEVDDALQAPARRAQPFVRAGIAAQCSRPIITQCVVRVRHQQFRTGKRLVNALSGERIIVAGRVTDQRGASENNSAGRPIKGARCNNVGLTKGGPAPAKCGQSGFDDAHRSAAGVEAAVIQHQRHVVHAQAGGTLYGRNTEAGLPSDSHVTIIVLADHWHMHREGSFAQTRRARIRVQAARDDRA